MIAIIFLGLAGLMIVSLWKIFEKAGKPGWASIVPLYNVYTMVEISKKPTWWFAMVFIPIANYIFLIMIINGISKSFGKNEGFTVGLIFLPFVFYPMLAFGDDQYIHSNQTNNTDLLDNI